LQVNEQKFAKTPLVNGQKFAAFTKICKSFKIDVL